MKVTDPPGRIWLSSGSPKRPDDTLSVHMAQPALPQRAGTGQYCSCFFKPGLDSGLAPRRCASISARTWERVFDWHTILRAHSKHRASVY